MSDVKTTKLLYGILYPVLDERDRRFLVAAGAISVGYGGVSQMSRATSLCCETVAHLINELKESKELPSGRIRKEGGGRKKTVHTAPTLKTDLEILTEPVTWGAPESPLRWT